LETHDLDIAAHDVDSVPNGLTVQSMDAGAGLFRVALPDGTRRWALGPPAGAPERMLPVDWSLDGALTGETAWACAIEVRASERVPPAARATAPIESQEVWAAGVTYLLSRDARLEESGGDDLYGRVYLAERPELFFKAAAWRVRGPGESIGIRADSAWNVPEPELGIVLTRDLKVVGMVLGNDVSSRTIEGENALYLPQAKIFDGSCALGPAILPISSAAPEVSLTLRIRRGDEAVYEGRTSTHQMTRPITDLASWLGRALTFPYGVVLLTGTGIVPPSTVSLQDGDVVTIAGTGLGELANPVTLVGRPDH
jgi:2-dehydro-3-deoxy-D-arabinonate dehydratase